MKKNHEIRRRKSMPWLQTGTKVWRNETG